MMPGPDMAWLEIPAEVNGRGKRGPGADKRDLNAV